MTTNPSVPTYVVGTVTARINETVPVTGVVKLPMDTLYKSDGTALTVKYSSDTVTAAGPNTVIAAVANKRIVVLQVTYWVTAIETIKWLSAATDITKAQTLAADEKIIEPFCPHGLFRTAVGEALRVDLTTGVNFRWHITYVEY